MMKLHKGLSGRVETVVLICLIMLAMFSFYRFIPKAFATSLSKAVNTSEDDVWVEDVYLFDKTATCTYLGNDGDNYGPSGIGMRFNSVAIPQGSTISAVYLHFHSFQDGTSFGDVNVHIACENVDNASGFTDAADYWARTRTAYVSWPTVESWSAGVWYYSVDISSILQTVINRAGWVSGNSLVVFCEDDGTSVGARFPSTYDDNPNNAPQIDSAGPPSKVDLFLPSNADTVSSTTQSLSLVFNYTPTFYASDAIHNSSLWMDYNGIWRAIEYNSTVVTNNTYNTFTRVFNFSEQTYATKQYTWGVEAFNSTTGVFSGNRTLTVNFFWSLARYPSLIDALAYFAKRTDWTDPTSYTDYGYSREGMAFAAYSLGYITQGELETIIEGSDSWTETLYCYYLGAKYGIENQTKIEWALNNATMLTNGLPETGSGYFIVYDRYVLQGYSWAEKYGYELSKWNKTTAYNNFVAFTGGNPVLEIFSDNSTYASTRWYDEYAETAEAYLEFYKIGITGAFAHAVALWNRVNNALWDTSHYDYCIGGTDYECSAGDFANIFLSLNNYTSLGNLTRLITDFGNRFLVDAWGSPQWAGTHNVCHTATNPQQRLQNSLQSWSVMFGMYDSFSVEQRANITKMMKGYDAYDPLWQLLMSSECFDSASSKFYIMTSDIVSSFTYTLLGAYLLLTYAVVPENATTLANLPSDIRYEDINSYLDQTKFSLDIPSRTLTLDLTNEGNVSFLFNQTVTHDFLVAGIYHVTFASDWNSIVSATLVSATTWAWVINAQDIQGFTLSNVTIKISQNGVTLYTNNTGIWNMNIAQSTYNVSVYWLQNMLVNTAENIHITADTQTYLNCSCYPYVIGGTRYLIASNSTISSTSATSDSVTANFPSLWWTDDFTIYNTTYKWQSVYGIPHIEPAGQLEMTSATNGRCSAISYLRDSYLNNLLLPTKYTVEFRLKIDQFGTGTFPGSQGIDTYDPTYAVRLQIYSNYFTNGVQNFSVATDNNWHTWTLICDHTGPTFDVYRDNVNLTSMLYVPFLPALDVGKISLDGYGGNNSLTDAHFDWLYIYSGLKVPTADTNQLLVASYPANPTYILGDAYDKTTCYDPYGYVVLNSTDATAITVSYANWGGLSIPMTDHALNSVASVTYGDLNINVSGTTGDFGHISINCDGKGNPWDAGGLTTSYSGTTLTGTYTFTDSSMFFWIRWYSASTGGSSGPPEAMNLPTNLLVNVFLSFPTFAQPGSIVNGTLNVTWSGYSSVYLWSVILNSGYRNWTLNMHSLPLLLEGLGKTSAAGLDGIASIPVTLTVPEGASVGPQQIPCTLTVQTTTGSGKAIRAYISLDLVGAQAQIPNVMTYGFVALVVGALVTMPLFMRSKKKKRGKP